MTNQHPVTCDAVIDRLVEAGGGPVDPIVAEHVGTCMSCFRAMTELRDVPRVAEALRAAAPPIPASDDRFWEGVARRATDAAAAALDGAAATPSRVAPAARASGRRLRGRFLSAGAVAIAAAAAGWAVMVHRPVLPGGTVATTPSAAHVAADDRGGEALSDVAELDEGALRRLLDRLGRHAPAALAGGMAETVDNADVPVDDESRVSDEVADLDGEALRRVASSLEASAL